MGSPSPCRGLRGDLSRRAARATSGRAAAARIKAQRRGYELPTANFGEAPGARRLVETEALMAHTCSWAHQPLTRHERRARRPTYRRGRASRRDVSARAQKTNNCNRPGGQGRGGARPGVRGVDLGTSARRQNGLCEEGRSSASCRAERAPPRVGLNWGRFLQPGSKPYLEVSLGVTDVESGGRRGARSPSATSPRMTIGRSTSASTGWSRCSRRPVITPITARLGAGACGSGGRRGGSPNVLS